MRSKERKIKRKIHILRLSRRKIAAQNSSANTPPCAPPRRSPRTQGAQRVAASSGTLSRHMRPIAAAVCRTPLPSRGRWPAASRRPNPAANWRQLGRTRQPFGLTPPLSCGHEATPPSVSRQVSIRLKRQTASGCGRFVRSAILPEPQPYAWCLLHHATWGAKERRKKACAHAMTYTRDSN